MKTFIIYLGFFYMSIVVFRLYHSKRYIDKVIFTILGIVALIMTIVVICIEPKNS